MRFWEIFARYILVLFYRKVGSYDADGVTYIFVKSFIRKSIGGMTWGRVVFIRNDVKGSKSIRDHEMVHVRQWHRHGFWFPFVYAKETIRSGWANGWKNAYYLNRFEIEAREIELLNRRS